MVLVKPRGGKPHCPRVGLGRIETSDYLGRNFFLVVQV